MANQTQDGDLYGVPCKEMKGQALEGTRKVVKTNGVRNELRRKDVDVARILKRSRDHPDERSNKENGSRQD